MVEAIERVIPIVGECRQLKTDLDSFNDAHSDEEPMQISFDFNMDIAEIEAALFSAVYLMTLRTCFPSAVARLLDVAPLGSRLRRALRLPR